MSTATADTPTDRLSAIDRAERSISSLEDFASFGRAITQAVLQSYRQSPATSSSSSNGHGDMGSGSGSGVNWKCDSQVYLSAPNNGDEIQIGIDTPNGRVNLTYRG